MVAKGRQPGEELTALREQREELHRELVRKTFRIAELEEQVAEVGRTFEESLSWRLTQPIRTLKPALKKLIR